jgi:hypothetical protein
VTNRVVLGRSAILNFTVELNKTIYSLEDEVMTYFDQSGTNPFLLEVRNIQKMIKDSLNSFFTIPVQDVINLLKDIESRYLKFVADWEAYKRQRPGEGESFPKLL